MSTPIVIELLKEIVMQAGVIAGIVALCAVVAFMFSLIWKEP
jgi:hypothetical protein